MLKNRKHTIVAQENSKRTVTILGFFGMVIAVLGIFASVMIGPTFFSVSAIMDTLFGFAGTEDQLIIRDVRIPRMIVTFCIGASLAVAGAIMQVLTQNPLGSPSIFGINAGASFVVVFSIIFLPQMNAIALAGAGFVGGLVAAGLIYVMSIVFRGGNMALKMALVGVVIQSLLSSMTQALLIFNEESTESLLFWLAGNVAGSQWGDVRILVPVTIGALVLAMLLSNSLTILNLGEDVAKGLGQRVKAVRAVSVIVVVLLAGVSVSVVGPIGFIGLLTPHMVRFFIRTDYRLIIPFAALFGGILLTLADIGSRYIQFPYETAVGIVTAFIGAPYFIYLARKNGGRNS